MCAGCAGDEKLKSAEAESDEYWSFFGIYDRRDTLIEKRGGALRYAVADADQYHQWFASGGRTVITRDRRAA